MSTKHLKIFISAYACEPQKGSEPGIGWNVVNELAKYHEVHVLTRSNNREAIEAALIGRSEAVPVFHYYDLPKWLTFWKKRRRGYHLYYYLWQYGAFFRYRHWVDTFGFDIVQHLTFANFSMPSLFMLCKATTVWGPIGTIPTPPAIFSALPSKVRIRETLRRWIMTFLCHAEPMRFLTPRAANWILEYDSRPDGSCFPVRWQPKVRRHPQTGVNTAEPEYSTERRRNDDGKIRLLICSEFLHWKGVVFSAEIFSRIARRRDDVELYLYGSGPEKETMAGRSGKSGSLEGIRRETGDDPSTVRCRHSALSLLPSRAGHRDFAGDVRKAADCRAERRSDWTCRGRRRRIGGRRRDDAGDTGRSGTKNRAVDRLARSAETTGRPWPAAGRGALRVACAHGAALLAAS